MTITDERPVAIAELVGVFEVASPEWHAARANGIGGSEIAAVLGISNWDSAFSLWHRKTGLIPPREANTEMDAGRRLEPVICDVFAERHPEYLVRKAGTYRNRERPSQIANPDRLLYPAGHERAPGEDIFDPRPTELFEAKFALYPDGWGEEGTDEVPVYYAAQCRWYLDVFGLRRCHLTVFIGSTGEFREYVIEADEQDTLLMRERGEEFMESLRSGRRPPIDGHMATYRIVKDMPEGQVDRSVEIHPLLRNEYFRSLAGVAAAETEKRRCGGLILDAIGDGRRAMCLEERVATRTVRNGKTYSLQPAKDRDKGIV